MSVLLAGLHLIVMLLFPPVLVGVINRTRAWWGGRRGASLLQPWWDLARLLHKEPVYSTASTVLFRLGPLVALGGTLLSALVVPVVTAAAPLSFDADFVALAYLWGLGRVVLMLAALDTGSAFEGMGAAREAVFAAVAEPALLLCLGALAALSGSDALSGLVAARLETPWAAVAAVATLATLVVVLQLEGGRAPVDDPATHLELTMIHEVMVLDHSGPELAAIQYGAALKLQLCAALLLAVVWPVQPGWPPWVEVTARLGGLVLVGVLVGTAEAWVARLRMSAVPEYLLGAVGVAGIALLAVLAGGLP